MKNLFVFMPVFFSVNITDLGMSARAVACFVSFCLTASGVYVFNDFMDVEADRQHPGKKFRPLASGQISKKSARLLFTVFIVSGLMLGAGISMTTMGVLLGYLLMNILYSVKLKHIAIIDVVIIAVGFVLRLWAGAVATGPALSSWIVIMSFLLALFLAFAKRRDDVLIFNATGKRMRRVIDGYNLQLVDAAMTLMAGIVIVAYIMYCTSEDVILRIGSDKVYLTALFVIIGVLRYMQISFVEERSGSPTRVLLRDRILQGTILMWGITFMILLYF